MASVAHAVSCPCGTKCKDWNFVFVGHVWRDECECWARTFTSAIVVAILGMWQAMQLLPVEPSCDALLFDRGGPRAVERKRLWQSSRFDRRACGVGVVVRAVHIVATEAGTPRRYITLARNHFLHTIFVGCAVGEMREGGLAELMFSSIQ